MLDPDWAMTRPLLWLALAGVLALLVVRTVRKDRKEYQRFKRYRTTLKRQAMFRRWLLESLLTFGGLSVVILLLAGAQTRPLLDELVRWPWLRDIRDLVASHGVLVLGIIVGATIALVAVTYLGVRAARRENDGVVTIGDIQSMLPRNKQELRLGALLSVNAGIVEETLFRLALPALVYGASGSALAAVLFSVLLFGVLHLYQGPWGVLGTTVVGALMMGFYVVSGTIVAPIVLHALFDLRSLVLIPVAVMGVHRIDGVAQPILPKVPTTPPPAVEPPSSLLE